MIDTDIISALKDFGMSAGMGNVLANVFDQMEWAEDEIKQAQARHPEQGDLLWRQFILLHTELPMPAEFIYRSHCRELLERVVAGVDVAEPTNAELAVVCSELSLESPLSAAGMAVYMRVFTLAFPKQAVIIFDDGDAALMPGGQEADQLERNMRRDLRQNRRVQL